MNSLRPFLLLSLIWLCLSGVLPGATALASAAPSQTRSGKEKPGEKIPPPSPRSKQPKKEVQSVRFGYIGDINLRVELGTRFFHSALIDGTFVNETIGRNSFELLFQPEYGYYFASNTVLVLSLPMRFEVDFIVGVFYSLQLGVGVRRFLGSYVFVEAQVMVDFVSKNQFAIRFAGLNPAVGLVIPLWRQIQLYPLFRVSVRFFPFLGFGLESNLGEQVLF